MRKSLFVVSVLLMSIMPLPQAQFDEIEMKTEKSHIVGLQQGSTGPSIEGMSGATSTINSEGHGTCMIADDYKPVLLGAERG